MFIYRISSCSLNNQFYGQIMMGLLLDIITSLKDPNDKLPI